VESDGLWEELDQLLGERSNNMVQLETQAQQFKEEMHQHAKIENEEVFPYAKTHISSAEFKKIGKAIAQRRGVKAQP
jgi:hemerythrin-like domain-containing protein